MQRIGILGGTFDPVHYGHLFMAQTAADNLGLDRVLFIPTGQSPHKDGSFITAPEHRFAMTGLAITGNPAFELSDIEQHRPGASYTVDTLAALHRLYPDDRLFYIIGADSLRDISTWKDAPRLLKMADFVAVSRIAHGIDSLEAAAKALQDEFGAVVHTISSPLLEISSTDIRRRINDGKSIRYLLPEPVRLYIQQHQLYQNQERSHG